MRTRGCLEVHRGWGGRPGGPMGLMGWFDGKCQSEVAKNQNADI